MPPALFPPCADPDRPRTSGVRFYQFQGRAEAHFERPGRKPFVLRAGDGCLFIGPRTGSVAWSREKAILLRDVLSNWIDTGGLEPDWPVDERDYD